MDTIGDIASILARCGDRKLIAEFLRSILTEKEAYDLSTRWQSVRLLEQGKSQRSIRDTLGVSLCKITRASRELKKKNSAMRRMMLEYGSK
jgi:TrpR family transcriptional regulator, trp operon repressor